MFFLSTVHVNYKFPTSSTEEAIRWKKIVVQKLNPKCRSYRAN
jgi:hypothetical protein